MSYITTKQLKENNQEIKATYAQKDGIYGELTAGNLVDTKATSTARELTYSTAAGTASIEGDGSAVIKSIHGKTIVWNQLVNPSKFVNSGSGTNYSFVKNANNGFTFTITDTITSDISVLLTENASANYVRIAPQNKFYYSINNTTTNINFRNSYNGADYNDTQGIRQQGSSDAFLLAIKLKTGLTAGTYTITPIIIDLTKMFGSGNEPSTVAEFKAMFPLDYYAYNSGELISFNGTGIKTVGFNQWDEEWDNGFWNANTGIWTPNANFVGSKNKFYAIPNTEYYVKGTNGAIINILAYDSSGAYISRLIANTVNRTFTTPANCYYLALYMDSSYGATYNHDICINLSWSGYRNGEYEPYWERTLSLPINTIKFNSTPAYIVSGATPFGAGWLSLTDGGSALTPAAGTAYIVNTTGEYKDKIYKWNTSAYVEDTNLMFPDGMKSVGSVYDELTESKAVKRIGSYTFTGNEVWTQIDSDPAYYCAISSISTAIKRPASVSEKANMIHSKLVTESYSNIDNGIKTSGIACIYTNGRIVISSNDYSNRETLITGSTLFFELATPIEATIDPPLDLAYKVADFGTEQLLPENDDEPTTSPIIADIKYSMNAVDTIRNLATDYIGKNSWDTFVTSMASIGYTVTTTWDNTNSKYNISVTYSRPEQLVAAPATPTSTGTKGNYALDDNYLYCCTGTNAWKKLSFNKNKVYSVRFSGSAAAGTREDDAIGMVANVAVGSATVTNDFDSVPFYNRPICCCTWDTTAHRWRVNAYKGEPGFAWDGSNGELMYECTPCAYSNNTDLNTYVSVTGAPMAGYTLFEIFPDWNTKIYLPVFNMGYVNSKPTSRAGVFPIYDSLTGFMSKAKAFDTKAHTETMAALFYETCLQYVEFATKDQQSIMLGACNLSYNGADTTIASVTSDTEFTMATGKASKFVAGQTVCIGSARNGTQRTSSVKIASISGDVITLATAVSNLAAGDFLSSRMYECGAAATVVTNASSGSPVSNSSGLYPCIWRGKENPWANGFSTICDVLIKRTGSEGAYTYKMHYLPDPTLYSDGAITSDYIECNFNLSTTDGYGKVISSDSRYPFIFCCSAAGGNGTSSTTYVSAYYYKPYYEVCALRFGGFFIGGRACGSYFYCHTAPSHSNLDYAARLFVLPY